ncbi:MAG: hypothetical protein HY074_00985 [Deltaproteobacteria bacterium]|nr:hypothetical protein [Deltaproteobacteria bacterium]
MSDELTATVGGLLNYAVSADRTASHWTNFFGKLDRPNDSSKVKAYVLEKIKAQLCDPTFADALANKESEAARAATTKNITELRAKVAAIAKPYKVFTEDELKCL